MLSFSKSEELQIFHKLGCFVVDTAPNQQEVSFMALENTFVELNEFQENQSGTVTPISLAWYRKQTSQDFFLATYTSDS